MSYNDEDDIMAVHNENFDNDTAHDNVLEILNSPRRNLSPSRRSPRSQSPVYESLKRSRRSRTRSRSRSVSNRRSRSPRNRRTQRDRSRDRRDRNRRSGDSRTRRNDRNLSSRQQREHFQQMDRELGLKYRWEKTVYISNIPYETRWTDLKDLFRDKVGDVMYCEVFEKDGRSQGVGSVEFKTEKDAERAVKIMHQYEMGNRKISVRIDGEGYKTRQAKELSVEGSRNRGSNQSSNGSHNNGNSDLASMVKSNILNLLGVSNPLGLPSLMGGLNNTPASANNASQTQLLNQLAAQLKVEGPVTNRIFVASLDYKVDEKKLKEVFNMAGQVQSCQMFRDRDGKSRGMAVIEFDTAFGALNAVSMFNNQTLLDRQMSVRFDTKPPSESELLEREKQAKARLPSGLKSIGKRIELPGSVGNLPLQQNTPLSMLTELGINLNGTAPSLGDNYDEGNNDNSNNNNSNQIQALMGSYGSNGNHSSSNRSSTNNISKVFVKNIPFTWDSRKLKEKFRQAGNIEYAEIKTRNGQSRGCALVRYSTPDQAVKGVELFNGSRFEGRTLEVNLDKMA